MTEFGRSRDPEQVPWRERPINEVVTAVQGVIGQKLIAYGIAEKVLPNIGLFAENKAEPSEDQSVVLRDMAEVIETMQAQDNSPEVIRAIMIGANPALNSQAPIEVFHNGESHRVVAVADVLSI